VRTNVHLWKYLTEFS